MDDSGDMLATPLSKLPPPAMQSRMDEPLQAAGGSGGSAPSYQDLMKDFSTTPSRGVEYESRPPSQAPSHNGGHMEEYEPMQQQFMPQQYQQQQMQQYAPQPQYQHNPLAYAMPAPTYTSPPPVALLPPAPKKKILSLDTLKSTRAWFAAITIFLFVWYALPKIKASIPALVSPLTGELSVPGVAAASAVAGLVLATISDHFITP